jgi:uncharacterized membrane protein YhhN
MNILIVVFAAGLLVGLLYCEKKEVPKARLAVKSLLSSLFILAAFVQFHPIPFFYYYRFLLIGMIFCLGGDVLLAVSGQKMFLCGLLSFLLGHVFYAAAFFNTAGFYPWTGIGLAISAIAGTGVFLWLRPHLGAMKIPVIFYIFVITAMVVGAWSMLGAGELKPAGRIAAFVGALAFYVSDIFVARQRFLRTDFVNRLIGLPLYYGGQFLLAFSIGWLSPIGG